ncbi:MAG: hypoxanthine phosphoribosyltransferase [Deltaproteobacteria bacterium]|nr:hypoxanthine phosphoribosyltransferase [Deltaproteobacteria bacterium]
MANRPTKIVPLFTAEQIQTRIQELARLIEREFHGNELVAVGVLKGAFVFMADLVRALKLPVRCDFLRVHSYEEDRSTGVVRLELDLTQSIVDQDVLLIEDIVDSGRTLKYLLKHIQAKRPRRVRVASLLYKELKPELKPLIDFLGFTVPDVYVIGYGLDSQGLYRSLPYVGHVQHA